MDEKKVRVFIMGDERRIEVPIDDLDYIFKGMRPRLMPYDDYKYVRMVLKKENELYLKGQIVHLSKVYDAVWKEYVKEHGIKENIHQRGRTYVKPRKKNT